MVCKTALCKPVLKNSWVLPLVAKWNCYCLPGKKSVYRPSVWKVLMWFCRPIYTVPQGWNQPHVFKKTAEIEWMFQLTKVFRRLSLAGNEQQGKAKHCARSAWFEETTHLCQGSAPCLLVSPAFGDTTTAPAIQVLGHPPHHGPEPARLKLAQGPSPLTLWSQALEQQKVCGRGQLVDANAMLLIFTCAVQWCMRGVMPQCYLAWEHLRFKWHSPSGTFPSSLLREKKKKERKLAFWCGVSGYGIIQIQHLPPSCVVPKGQHLTLLLPIALCTRSGLWGVLQNTLDMHSMKKQVERYIWMLQTQIR